MYSRHQHNAHETTDHWWYRALRICEARLPTAGHVTRDSIFSRDCHFEESQAEAAKRCLTKFNIDIGAVDNHCSRERRTRQKKNVMSRIVLLAMNGSGQCDPPLFFRMAERCSCSCTSICCSLTAKVTVSTRTSADITVSTQRHEYVNEFGVDMTPTIVRLLFAKVSSSRSITSSLACCSSFLWCLPCSPTFPFLRSSTSVIPHVAPVHDPLCCWHMDGTTRPFEVMTRGILRCRHGGRKSARTSRSTLVWYTSQWSNCLRQGETPA